MGLFLPCSSVVLPSKLEHAYLGPLPAGEIHLAVGVVVGQSSLVLFDLGPGWDCPDVGRRDVEGISRIVGAGHTSSAALMLVVVGGERRRAAALPLLVPCRPSDGHSYTLRTLPSLAAYAWAPINRGRPPRRPRRRMLGPRISIPCSRSTMAPASSRSRSTHPSDVALGQPLRAHSLVCAQGDQPRLMQTLFCDM